MPKSKHRKITSRIGRAETLELADKRASARRKIYDRALPQFQEYPPLQSLSSADRHSIVIRVLAKAEERRQRRNLKRHVQLVSQMGLSEYDHLVTV